jgi:DNA-binding MarR family transcriptional regulator
MERAGLIHRVRAADDRRKVRMFLTAKARRLRNELLAVAQSLTAAAEKGIAQRDLAAFRRTIARMTENLDRIER